MIMYTKNFVTPTSLCAWLSLYIAEVWEVSEVIINALPDLLSNTSWHMQLPWHANAYIAFKHTLFALHGF